MAIQTILIIGATGLVGGALYETFKNSKFNVNGTYFKEQKNGLYQLDIRKRKDVEKLFDKLKPDVTILTAALTNVDYCEDYQEEAWEMNVNGTKNVVEVCEEFKSKIVFISTDYVFNGKNGPYKEDDKHGPISFYGKTKLEGENLVKKLDEYIIVRTTWVYDYGFDTKNFIVRLISSLQKCQNFHVPVDQYATPTLATNLAELIKELVMKEKKGTYNITGLDFLSKYEFALKVAEKLGFDKSLIKGVDTKSLAQKAKRPMHAGLMTEKIKKELVLKPLSLNDSLEILKQKFIKDGS